MEQGEGEGDRGRKKEREEGEEKEEGEGERRGREEGEGENRIEFETEVQPPHRCPACRGAQLCRDTAETHQQTSPPCSRSRMVSPVVLCGHPSATYRTDRHRSCAQARWL